jgi:hypothetical protein
MSRFARYGWNVLTFALLVGALVVWTKLPWFAVLALVVALRHRAEQDDQRDR